MRDAKGNTVLASTAAPTLDGFGITADHGIENGTRRHRPPARLSNGEWGPPTTWDPWTTSWFSPLAVAARPGFLALLPGQL